MSYDSKNRFCTSCGNELLLGSNLCENCGKLTSKPTEFPNKQNVISPNMNFPENGSSYTQTSPFIEFVNQRPSFISFSEVKQLFLAYSVIYLGFVTRRIIFNDNQSIFNPIIETFLVIMLIFGFWFIIDKVISYHYNFYPKFIFRAEKSFISFIFAFIFIGFPPGIYKYRIWMGRLPKPENILKIQLKIYYVLILWGWLIFFITYFFQIPNLEILKIIPFIISISVGMGIIPYGNFKLVLNQNKWQYYSLAVITILLFLVSYPSLILLNF